LSLPAGSTLYRATIFHTTGDPFASGDAATGAHFSDGGLLVDRAGGVLKCDAFDQFQLGTGEGATGPRVVNRPGCIILPAMVDCHVHYPQVLAVAGAGGQLLDWLERCIFPEEMRYANPDYARSRAQLFFDEMIRSGTGTALIFGPHFEEATGIAFDEARRRRFRALLGMSLADRNMPAEFCMEPEQARRASERLIAAHHGKAKCRYAVTPRFAPACTPAMLDTCRQLISDHPGTLLQTHINENRREITWCRELFPGTSDYLAAYEQAGLLGARTVLAHNVHPQQREFEAIAASDTRVAHCPDSNAFLGSGLFPLRKHVQHHIKVGLGTDVAGGTTFSLFAIMKSAYQMQMLQLDDVSPDRTGMRLTGNQLLYLATLGGARALGLEAECGSFLPGRRADFLVIDPALDPYIQSRLATCQNLAETLFVLTIAGHKGLIREVHLDGEVAYQLPR
jgi:guanine deaminase